MATKMDESNELSVVVASPDGQATPPPKRAKRSRVQAACQRCQTRKQKCDGNQPECSTCVTHGLKCRYIVPSYHKPTEAKKYIKALESRVAELETVLTNGGLRDAGLDHWHQREPEAADEEEGQDGYSPLAAVRDVSHNTSGSFIGGTSTLTLARMLESILGVKEQFQIEQSGPAYTNLLEAATPEYEYMSNDQPALKTISSTMADKLLGAYFRNVAVNFPVVHSVQIRDFHRRREILDDPYEESILNLVYGLGGQFLEMTGGLGNYQWRMHYEAALEKRDRILRLGDTRKLSYLLLLIQQCVRVPRDVGGWTFVGIAMRFCVELGLHRKKRSNIKPTLQSELEKRLFWVCYYFDRDFAMALGRPPSISDHDIDVELPLDVDEECQDAEVFRHAEFSDVPASPSTTLTCFVHCVRLKRIESRIQHKIYRVDVFKNNVALETETFLGTLEAWKDAIPTPSHVRDDHSKTAYMLHFHKCTRLLLQPQLYEININERYLKLCTEACVGICETYRRLHDFHPLSFSTISLQTIFLAGLTLVYCMWHAPSSNAIQNMSAMSDCTVILYIMTERWPNIRRYRDAFEAIKRSVLHLIAEGKHQPRKVIPPVPGDVWSKLQNLDSDMFENFNGDDLEQIISDMTGEGMQFPLWNNNNVNVIETSDMGQNNTGLNLDMARW